MPTKEFVAGSVSGAASVLTSAPLDMVRVRMQIMKSTHLYSTPWSAFCNTVKREGPLSLFKGVAAPFWTMSLQNAVVFHTYGSIARWLEPGYCRGQKLKHSDVWIAGFGAGAVQTPLLTVVDYVKIQRQRQTESGIRGGRCVTTILRDVIRTDGILGPFRGIGITLVRDAPSHAVYFAAYDATTTMLQKSGGERNGLSTLASGGFAGVISWFVVYPLDLIKSRIQSAREGSRWTTITEVAEREWKSAGLRGFTHVRASLSGPCQVACWCMTCLRL